MNTEQNLDVDGAAAPSPNTDATVLQPLSSPAGGARPPGSLSAAPLEGPGAQAIGSPTQHHATSGPGRMPSPSPIIRPRAPFPDHRLLIAPPTEVWPEPVDGRLLLDELRRTFSRFVVLPGFVPETLALWILHTYAFHLGDVSAYLGIESPVKRCGKTTLLGVLDKLAHRPVLAANISFKAFFHVIEHARPTLLIDETDTFLPANDELRGILNAGYHRETAFVIRFAQSGEYPTDDDVAPVTHSSRRPVLRSLGEGGSIPAEADHALVAPKHPSEGGSRFALHPSTLYRFSCWCPKAMAAIGRLPDTLADRRIRICMHRKTPNEKCERLRNLRGADLTRQCARFVLDNQDAIAAARPEIPAALNDRAADIWEPLLALADLAGGEWPDLARKAAVALGGAGQAQDTDGLVEELLAEILNWILCKKCRRILSRDLVGDLTLLASMGRPWSSMLKGKPATEHWLANTLRPYGICTKSFRIGKIVARGYCAEDFYEAFQRYLPRPDIEVVPPDPAPVSPPPQSAPPPENPNPVSSSSSSLAAPKPCEGGSPYFPS